VLIVDELGFVPFDRVGGELLFNLITDRDVPASAPEITIEVKPGASAVDVNFTVAPKQKPVVLQSPGR
jgi:hypothetical protein